jgi:opacity protein-like surface antigen
VVDGFGNLIYYEIENREAKERTLGLQMPLALAFEATKFNAYIGTALNLDLLYLTKYRKVGSSSWSSKSVGIDKLESNQIFGLSLVLGASYWVTDNISIGYRHDNGFGDWGWTSNNVCVSFKLK